MKPGGVAERIIGLMVGIAYAVSPMRLIGATQLTLSKNGLDAGKGTKLEDMQVQQAAACLGSLFQISLDGEKSHDIHFDFTIEQSSGLEGIVSFLPLDALEPGRHELLILAPSKPRQTGEDKKAPEPVRHLIPFRLRLSGSLSSALSRFSHPSPRYPLYGSEPVGSASLRPGAATKSMFPHLPANLNRQTAYS